MDQGDLANNDPASNGADGLLGSLMDLLEDEEEFDEDDEDLEGQEAVEFMNSSDFDNMEGNMLDLMLEPAAAPQETFEPAAESEDWEDVEDLVVSVPEIWMPRDNVMQDFLCFDPGRPATSAPNAAAELSYLQPDYVNYPIRTSNNHFQTADSLAATTVVEGGRTHEELLLSTGRLFAQKLQVYRLHANEPPELRAETPLLMAHYTLARSPCGEFVAAGGKWGMVILFQLRPRSAAGPSALDQEPPPDDTAAPAAAGADAYEEGEGGSSEEDNQEDEFAGTILSGLQAWAREMTNVKPHPPVISDNLPYEFQPLAQLRCCTADQPSDRTAMINSVRFVALEGGGLQLVVACQHPAANLVYCFNVPRGGGRRQDVGWLTVDLPPQMQQARLLRLSLPCSNPRPGMKLPAVTAKRLPILVRSYLQGDQQQDAEPEATTSLNRRVITTLYTAGYRGFRYSVNCAQPSADGKWLAVCMDRPTILILPTLHAATPSDAHGFSLSFGPSVLPGTLDRQGELGSQYCAFSPDGSLLAATSDALRRLFVWDLRSRQLIHTGQRCRVPCMALGWLPRPPGADYPDVLAYAERSDGVRVCHVINGRVQAVEQEFQIRGQEKPGESRVSDWFSLVNRINGLAMMPSGRLAVATGHQLSLLQLLVDWRPEMHADFPPRFRAAIRCLLLASKQSPELRSLPRDVLELIIAKAAHPFGAWHTRVPSRGDQHSLAAHPLLATLVEMD